MSQKIVGNFVVGTVYSREDDGKWRVIGYLMR